MAVGEAGLVIREVEFLLSAFKLNQLPPAGPLEIAFAGRSNVGKSSLLNRLLNRRNLVKVSASPGKTRSLNYYLMNKAFHLVDLPGYGYAKVDRSTQAHWGELIAAYLESRPTLAGVVVIIDLRHALKELDRLLVEWLRERNIPILPVYTKADKLSRNEQQRQARQLDAGLGLAPAERVIFSALSGEGRDLLLAKISLLLNRPGNQPVALADDAGADQQE